MIDLSGKVAVITGSSRGLGLAIARGLAQAGAALVVNGRATVGEFATKPSTKLGVLGSYRTQVDGGEFGVLVDVSYADHKFNRPISFNCDPRSGPRRRPPPPPGRAPHPPPSAARP